MSTTKRYEIQAIAFNIMTGYMAPGKDVPIDASDYSYAKRLEAWNRWRDEHGKCIRAMLQAFDHLKGE